MALAGKVKPMVGNLEATAIILNFQMDALLIKAADDKNGLCLGMTDNIIERFLYDAKDWQP
jgi:hypothetical protein